MRGRVAAAGETPAPVSPLDIALGSVLASPTAIRVKNPPIDSTMPAFMPVARMPEAAPRCAAGTAFMIAAEFGRGHQAHADAVEREQRARTARS